MQGFATVDAPNVIRDSGVRVADAQVADTSSQIHRFNPDCFRYKLIPREYVPRLAGCGKTRVGVGEEDLYMASP
jgi:hypothetical protein